MFLRVSTVILYYIIVFADRKNAVPVEKFLRCETAGGGGGGGEGGRRAVTVTVVVLVRLMGEKKKKINRLTLTHLHTNYNETREIPPRSSIQNYWFLNDYRPEKKRLTRQYRTSDEPSGFEDGRRWRVTRVNLLVDE